MIIYQKNSVEIPEQVEVSSTGEAAVSTARMGVYELKNDTWLDRPVWKGIGGDNYIYLSRVGQWAIGKEIGDEFGGIASTSSHHPSPHLVDQWEYVDVDGEWKMDATLTCHVYEEQGINIFNCCYRCFVIMVINIFHCCYCVQIFIVVIIEVF